MLKAWSFHKNGNKNQINTTESFLILEWLDIKERVKKGGYANSKLHAPLSPSFLIHYVSRVGHIETRPGSKFRTLDAEPRTHATEVCEVLTLSSKWLRDEGKILASVS